MTIQSSTQIGDVIRNAVVFNIKNWLGGMMNSDSLIQSVQDFFTILEQRKIDYVLVGGIAILHYIEGRNTQDLDVLMAVSRSEKEKSRPVVMIVQLPHLSQSVRVPRERTPEHSNPCPQKRWE